MGIIVKLNYFLLYITKKQRRHEQIQEELLSLFLY